MLKSVLANKDFPARLVIGWQQSRQPIRSHATFENLCYLTWILKWKFLCNTEAMSTITSIRSNASFCVSARSKYFHKCAVFSACGIESVAVSELLNIQWIVVQRLTRWYPLATCAVPFLVYNHTFALEYMAWRHNAVTRINVVLSSTTCFGI